MAHKTTTDELRVAAERYTRPYPATAYPYPCDMHEQPAQRSADAAKLARAYLAEHPADDAEPVTAEWLELSGWRRDEGDEGDVVQTWSIREPEADPVGEGLVTVADDGSLGWSAYFGGYDFDQWPRQLGTRGDVRRLLAALGVGPA